MGHVVNSDLSTVVYFLGAALFARSPRAVLLAHVGHHLGGDALDRLLAELHEDGGEGRLDDERDEEEESEQAEDGQQNEEGRRIEEKLFGEALVRDALISHSGLASWQTTQLSRPRCSSVARSPLSAPPLPAQVAS